MSQYNIGAGTNFATTLPGSTVTKIVLTDDTGLAILALANTTGETTAGTYQIGCLLIRTDAGTLYQNTGTVAIPVWTVNGTGASGASGASGVSGATVSGFSGVSGASGASGASGVSGVSGVSGAKG